MDQKTTCPNCNRDVEAGMRFCDACGTKLEAGSHVTPIAPPDDKDLSELWDGGGKPPLTERRRARREAKAARKSEASKAEDVPAPAPVPAVDPPPPRPRSQVTRAEDLKTATSQGRAGISGRLRWQDDPAPAPPPAPAPAPPMEELTPEPVGATTWRPATVVDSASPAAIGALFAVHLVVSLLVGAVLLGIAAVVASLTSDGRVALLEIRGLPIFIGGATSIIVFALLRTGPRPNAGRRSVAISVFVGFVLLVLGVALAYQPSVMRTAQSRLDRSLGVFGSDVAEGVERFAGDVDQWNFEVQQYRDDHLATVLGSRKSETDAKKFAKAEQMFRIAAGESESALDGLVKRMRSHADAIRHAPLRDALGDLTAIFAEELTGIRSITRGLTNNDTVLTESGDTRFKDATQRAVDFFEERVRPILERGELDADSFGLSVEELRG